MKLNNFIFIILIFNFIILVGCQQQIDENVILPEPETDKIAYEQIIDDALEKEFDDNLDEALKELEEVENI